MARNAAYPVDLVQNLDQAMRPQAPGAFTSRPPVAIDLMIHRALLAHPILEPGAGSSDGDSSQQIELPAPPQTRTRTH